MTSTLPTRSQLEDAMEFFASFAGSAYKDGGIGHLEIGGRPPVACDERALQTYVEKWLREHWSEMVDCMVESHCALEDHDIPEKGCPRTEEPRIEAHGAHYWDASQFQKILGPAGGDLQEFHCDGIKAHPRCMIVGGRNA